MSAAGEREGEDCGEDYGEVEVEGEGEGEGEREARDPPFDTVIMVDWSAAATPKSGVDSVWWALHRRGAAAPERLENPKTRAEAVDALEAALVAELGAGRRSLVGFDFPFGYPQGSAEAFLRGEGATAASRTAPAWAALWRLIAGRIHDGPQNANNRFEVAAWLNRTAFDGRGPFWGRPPRQEWDGLPQKKPDGYGARYPAERRAVERLVRSTQPVWKLFTTGSVGGQTLMGLAALERLRHRAALAGQVAVWPFETGWRSGRAPIVFAEIYPSLLPPDPREAIKDAGQVRAVAARLAERARENALTPLFEGPNAGEGAVAGEEALDPCVCAVAATEEAWILGVDGRGPVL